MLCTSEHFPLCTLWVHTFTRVVAKFVKVSNSKKCKCLMSMDVFVLLFFFFFFWRQKANPTNAKMNTTKEKIAPSPRGGGTPRARKHRQVFTFVLLLCYFCFGRFQGYWSNTTWNILSLSIFEGGFTILIVRLIWYDFRYLNWGH